MVIDMNYWSKVFRKILILFLTIFGVYLAFKFAIFYMPFLIAFILSLLLEFLLKRRKNGKNGIAGNRGGGDL